jgi:hypothetical protein
MSGPVTPHAIGFGQRWSATSPDGAPTDHAAADEGYTSTRFVLPFQPRLCRCANPGPSIGRFRVAQESDWILENKRGREWYLTAEMRRALFERVHWHVWDDDQRFAPDTVGNNHDTRLKRFEIESLDGTTVHLAIRPPALLLFEAGAPDPKDGTADLLKSGFLVIELLYLSENDLGPRLDDVLMINELFRFRACPWDQHFKDFGKQMKAFGSYGPVKDDGPDKDQCYLGRWLTWLQDVEVAGLGRLRVTKEDLEIYADSRAFTCARVVMPDNELREIIPHAGNPADDSWAAETDAKTGKRSMFGYWVKVLNSDQPERLWKNGYVGFKEFNCTNDSTCFERDWAASRTYRRWEHRSCYYGFNDFSAAMLTGPNSSPPAWQHWERVYFDEILLLLYLRVTLFRFSDRLSEISTKARDQSGDDSSSEWRKSFRSLRRQFTFFENLYQFPLLSNQQQAIELYALARSKMSIDDFYTEVSNEIHGSDALMDAEVGAQRSDRAESLNVIVFAFGSLALIFTAVPAVFNALAGPTYKWLLSFYTFAVSVVVLVAGLLLFGSFAVFLLRWDRTIRARIRRFFDDR